MAERVSHEETKSTSVVKSGIQRFFHSISYLVNGHSRPGQELEQRLCTSVLFLCAIGCIISFSGNLALHFPLVLLIGTALAGVLFGFFWFLARHGIHYTKLMYPATVTLVATLSFIWIFNGGSKGGSQLFLLLCPFVFVVFSRGAGRIIALGTYGITVVFLYVIEYTNPEIILGYASETDRFIDVCISFFITTLLAVTFVMVLHNGYRKIMAKADAEKRASESRFFETADMLPVGICEAGRDLSISFLNRAGYELTGFGDMDFDGGHTMLDLIHPDDRDHARSDFSTILAGNHLPLREYRLVRKDGKPLKVLLQCDHVYADGAVAGLRMCMLDITEKKALEEQYRQSQKMESVGLLAGGVAHDFNNILSAVMGYASLMRLENRERDKAAYDPKIDEQTTAILNAGDRATDLVRKLLAFSRQGVYEVKPLSIHALIDEVVALLAHSIDKRITIAKSLTALNPVVEGDQSLLQSALLNLGINARDAMPEGGTLTFTTKSVTVDSSFAHTGNFAVTPGPYIAVTVADTGIGMDAHVKKHIFEPFFTTKEAGKGTGLGLASVFGTVTRHGGFIDVQSDTGRGTSMTCFLPQSGTSPDGNKAPIEEKKKTRSLHVVVVDDESMICDFVKEFLTSEGHKTTAFTNPTQAIEWYKSNYAGVDCIILDMNMPVIDGKTCFAAMHRINPKAKAIFATGFMVGDTAAIIRMPGIKGYIQKPFSLDRLVEAINQAVDGGPATGP